MLPVVPRCVCIGLLAIATFLASTSAGLAALIVRDWKTSGDGLITYDTDTNLEWLHLGETVGMSYSAVDSQTASGGSFEGFQIATGSDVDSLFGGADGPSYSVSIGAGPRLFEVLQDLGPTDSSPSGHSYLDGFYDDGGLVDTCGLADINYYVGIISRNVFSNHPSSTVPITDPATGVFLTRQVPEPSTLAFWSSLALCGIVYGMRRRKT